jgi:DNA-binding CsgD family transcriptional regulator
MPSRPSPSSGPGPNFRKSEISDDFETPYLGNSMHSLGYELNPPSFDGPLSVIQASSADLRPQHQIPKPHGAHPDISIALGYGLELVRYGAMLVAAEGRLRLANRAALSILGKKDGLWNTAPGLVTERASDTRLLLRLLHEAIYAPENGEPKDSPIMLPRKFARTSLIVRVIPGPGISAWPDADGGAAMLMLYDQDMGFEVNISLLIRLYGLTRGEAALAASLMRGRSIEEAATELFISPHTARTHLKRIFMKTDTHRQTELVIRAFPAIL